VRELAPSWFGAGCCKNHDEFINATVRVSGRIIILLVDLHLIFIVV
jgi:hypothetical protein